MLRLLAVTLLAGAVPGWSQPAMPRTLADADRLEAQVDASPEDVPTRTLLLTYYSTPGVPADRVKAALRKHVVWLVENRPEHASLRMTWAVVAREGKPTADPDAYAAVDRAWRHHLESPNPSASVYANALHFYTLSDAAFAHKVAADALKAYPNHADVGYAVGTLLAYEIGRVKGEDQYGRPTVYDDSPQAAEREQAARKELASAKSAGVLGGAGNALFQQTFAPGARQERAEELIASAESLLKQANELEPNNPRWGIYLSTLYTSSAARQRDPKAKIAILEKALGLGNPQNQMTPMDALAVARLDAGDYPGAAATARDLLALAAKYPDFWAYSNAVHHGNIVLGRVALHDGDRVEAARRLLVAGGVKGSPQLNSFGPDWQLASELMANGDRDVVLQYIDLCRAFWTSGAKRLDTWASAIKAGGVPNLNGRPELVTPDLTGKPAPTFVVPLLGGAKLSLDDLRGKPVLLDFWATWCAPCREEMPVFEKLHRELKDVAIVAVDVGESEGVVAEFIAKQKYTFPVALMPDIEATAKYGVNAYPSLVAVDAGGKVVEYAVGGRREPELRDIVTRARRGAALPRPGLVAPKQLSPAPGAVFDHYPRVTTLVWAPVEGAIAYIVEWDYRDTKGWSDTRPQYAVASAKVTDPVHTMNFVGAQPGRWRVTALDAQGNKGQPSPWREFRYTH